MEELVSTEALEREILEDARKKAERLLRGADEEARRIADAVEPKRAAAAAELERGYGRAERRLLGRRHGPPTLSRRRGSGPNTSTRGCGRPSAPSWAPFPRSASRALVEARLAAAAEYLDGRDLRVRRRSMDAAAAERAIAAALPRAKVVEMAEDAKPAGATALSSRRRDGASSPAGPPSTIVEEALLDERRGELACGPLRGGPRHRGAPRRQSKRGERAPYDRRKDNEDSGARGRGPRAWARPASTTSWRWERPSSPVRSSAWTPGAPRFRSTRRTRA